MSKDIFSRLKYLYADAFLDTYFSKATKNECTILPIVMLSQIVETAFDVVIEQNKYCSFIRPFTAKNITAFVVSYIASKNGFISHIPLSDFMREKIMWEIDRLLKFIKHNTQWEKMLYKSLSSKTWFKMNV